MTRAATVWMASTRPWWQASGARMRSMAGRAEVV